MERSARELFERYARFFARALAGEADMDEAAPFYADAFIAASPAGIAAGRNDDRLKQAMAEGYERYRAIGTKTMTIRSIRLSPIDEHHAIAHVGWVATYVRDGQPNVAIEFDVHYLVQKLDGEPKIFGWISGDEQAVLREHGLV